jgi:hypothetical protein
VKFPLPHSSEEAMRKLRFKGTVNFMEYHSHRVDFVDGEVKEVPDDVADYLLGDFGEFFDEIEPETREISHPIKHRMIQEPKAKKTTRRKPKK